MKRCLPDQGHYCAYRDADHSHYSDTWFAAGKITVDASYFLPVTQTLALTRYGDPVRYSAVSPGQILPALAGSDALQAVAPPIQGLIAYSYSWD